MVAVAKQIRIRHFYSTVPTHVYAQGTIEEALYAAPGSRRQQ